MDNILTVIQKGLAVIETLESAGKTVLPAVKALTDLVSKAKSGPVSEEELDQTEQLLDAEIADFNEPIPD